MTKNSLKLFRMKIVWYFNRFWTPYRLFNKRFGGLSLCVEKQISKTWTRIILNLFYMYESEPHIHKHWPTSIELNYLTTFQSNISLVVAIVRWIFHLIICASFQMVNKREISVFKWLWVQISELAFMQQSTSSTMIKCLLFSIFILYIRLLP